jgi:hypothetical protein
MQYLHPEIQCCGLILRDLEIPALGHLAHAVCSHARTRAVWLGGGTLYKSRRRSFRRCQLPQLLPRFVSR